jgi:hypothetical protein
MLPRKHIYLSVLLSPHEPYRGHRFLQFSHCKCTYTLPRSNVYLSILFLLNARIRCPGNKPSHKLGPTASRPVSLGIKYPRGAYDSTCCAYMLQRDCVYLSVTMFCNVFTYPFSTLILGTKLP